MEVLIILIMLYITFLVFIYFKSESLYLLTTSSNPPSSCFLSRERQYIAIKINFNCFNIKASQSNYKMENFNLMLQLYFLCESTPPEYGKSPIVELALLNCFRKAFFPSNFKCTRLAKVTSCFYDSHYAQRFHSLLGYSGA